ncbi:hypothetical protein KI387_011124, partial [Taxus chinensis]
MMGDSAKYEELILDMFGELDLEACFEEEETDEEKIVHAYSEKEKGKLVYMIDDEEVENLYVDYTIGMREVLDSVDENAHAYHEPMKMNKVNIGTYVKTKEAIIGDY